MDRNWSFSSFSLLSYRCETQPFERSERRRWDSRSPLVIRHRATPPIEGEKGTTTREREKVERENEKGKKTEVCSSEFRRGRERKKNVMTEPILQLSQHIFPLSPLQFLSSPSSKMRTNAVNAVFFLLALALGLAMAQLPVSRGCFMSLLLLA